MSDTIEVNNKINLPKTSFSMKANLYQKEPIIQKEWENKNIYNKILEQNKDNFSYILHDGPPYANGNIHLGHALNKVLKDIILKYEAMVGKNIPFIPGWDCHGLPIEFQLLKEMNTDKNSIDQLKFRKKAANFAEKFIKIQKEEFKRLGIFGDWEHSYLTLTPEYEGNIIKVFRELVNKGYIYRGLKPVYWCVNCETALAEAEIEYNEHISTSVFVKFPIKGEFLGEKNVQIIIWTTTPWTLPSNVAVAAHPVFDYVIFEVQKTLNRNINEKEKFIVAKDLLNKVSEKLNIKEFKILKIFKGKELENINCFSPYRHDLSVGVLANYVTIEDGTGIVHIAPGHGDDDYIVGKKYNLPIITPIDDKGNFTNTVEFSNINGINIFKANSIIIQDLDTKRLLLNAENIEHSYPHCWRCKEPVIFRATNQWFLDLNHNALRQRILNICNDVKWIPEYGKNRIVGMIENRPDWCLSRQRLWGTPIPAFYCKECGELLLTNESILAVEKVFLEKGSDIWFYKEANDILPTEIKCLKCGGKNFEKEKDIFDVWFDSGTSAEAVLRQRKNLKYPADLYLEGSDQHRGWFQASLIISTALYDNAPFETVLTHGFTVDREGKKMSKSAFNGVAPSEIMNKFGADILRLWISSTNYQEDMRIADDIIQQTVDAYRKIRNTSKYILGNLNGFKLETQKVEYQDMLEIDKWILAELSVLTINIIEHFEKRDFYLVYHDFYNFCNIELSSLYFDILKDRLYVMPPKSQERRSAQTVLYYLASFLPRIIAPIIPFTAEEIWQNFLNKTDKKESILLEKFVYHSNEEKQLIELWSSDKSILTKWRNFFEFRKILLKKIEEKRLEKIIGNSLEAKVKIFINDEINELNLSPLKNAEFFWRQIAIVSQVEIKIDDKVDEKILIDSSFFNKNLTNKKYEGLKIGIVVEKASGEKCNRCWNWAENLLEIDGQKICDRCIEYLKNW
ncbi:MAG: isoleucine--tRNA ligase [Elusimicrobiota bacterium]|jgi:isoleucyl-tRNA synthetase|nr:isoleucine--tRNA ligase [Elusimicrobiota bacterium]